MCPAGEAQGGHLSSLDGVRGIAAAIVVGFHTLPFVAIPPDVRNAWLATPLGLLVNGPAAVHIFFVLSGYVLALSAGRDRGVRAVTAFWTRRVLRIHPPYVAALLFAWALSFAYVTPALAPLLTRTAAHWVHLNLQQLGLSLLFPSEAFWQLPVGWSLFVEMMFSLLFPLLLWICRRSHWALLLLMAIPLTAVRDPYFRYFNFTLDFALGIAAWNARTGLDALLSRRGAAFTVAWLLAATALAQAPFLLAWQRFGHAELRTGHDPTTISMMALGCAMWLAGAVHLPRIRSAFSTPVATFLGRISYSLYLVHHAILVLLASLAGGRFGVAGGLVLFAVVSALSIGLAVLGQRFVERPAIRAGRFLSRRIRRAPA